MDSLHEKLMKVDEAKHPVYEVSFVVSGFYPDEDESLDKHTIKRTVEMAFEESDLEEVQLKKVKVVPVKK